MHEIDINRISQSQWLELSVMARAHALAIWASGAIHTRTATRNRHKTHDKLFELCCYSDHTHYKWYISQTILRICNLQLLECTWATRQLRKPFEGNFHFSFWGTF